VVKNVLDTQICCGIIHIFSMLKLAVNSNSCVRRVTVSEHKQVRLTGNGIIIAGRGLVFERWTELRLMLETGDSWTVIYEIWSVLT
jgi:hypothetical protein